ncbi:PilZ domain-containing protein [Lysobacter yangpyeongensis]|jgi:hypothetical protein|uniref:PilZ domain-containing protein n=1 Tax=Lysobacter yangpyeongensis TaxID=346182 RepID=A0ABW0SIK5_9GAMM
MDTERRRHPRQNTLKAIMFTPNGERHAATVLDVSQGGARMRLPEDDWTPREGANLRLFFEIDPVQTVAVQGRVVRVCVDHLGVQFAPAQERQIYELLTSLS